MANSYVDYTGNGSTTTWSIPFSFISRTDVSVIKLSDDSAISFTFVNDSQITISPAVADTITFRVRRLTQITSRLTDFINGSNLTEADLDLAMNQDFFLAQENKDYLNSKVGVPNSSLDGLKLPAPEASKMIQWNSGATALENGLTSGTITTAVTSATDAATSATSAAASATSATASATSATASAASASAAASGLFKWKDSCRATSETNITLLGTQTIDGVVLVADDRVLVQGQTDTEDNGIYTVASGAWVRSTKMDTATDFPSAATLIEEGTTNSDKLFICTTNNPVVVGTTAITWTPLGSASSESTFTLFRYTTTTATTYSGADDLLATLSYTAGSIIVTLNGVVMEALEDYTASNGTSVVLTVAPTSGDELNIYAFSSFSTSDTVAKSTGGTFTGGVTATGLTDAGTGATKVATGTTAQRPVNGAGKLRFNSTESELEVNDGSAWGSIGGGAINDIFYENAQTVLADYTITTNKNAMSAGEITIDTGVTVTVPTNSNWVVV